MKVSSAAAGKRKMGSSKKLSSLRSRLGMAKPSMKGRAKSSTFGKPRMKGPKPTRIY